MIDFVCRCSPGTLTRMMRVFCARVFLASLSLFFPLSSLRTNEQTLVNSFLFNENTNAFRRQKSVKSLINYQIYRSPRCFRRRKIQTFCGTLILLSHLFFFVFFLSFFLSFFLFERFLFERERERSFLRFRARESERFSEQRERDLFYENVLLLGTKMGTKSTASFRRRRTRRTTTTTQRVDGGNDATPHRGFTDGEAAVDELGEDDTNYC